MSWDYKTQLINTRVKIYVITINCDLDFDQGQCYKLCYAICGVMWFGWVSLFSGLCQPLPAVASRCPYHIRSINNVCIAVCLCMSAPVCLLVLTHRFWFILLFCTSIDLHQCVRVNEFSNSYLMFHAKCGWCSIIYIRFN